MRPAARDDIVLRHIWSHSLEIRGIELAVAVAQQQVRLRSRAYSGNYRAPVAAIYRMMHHLDVAVLGREPVGNRTGPVAAPVVNHDHLEEVGDPRQFRQISSDHAFDVPLLVVRRQEDAQPGQANGNTHARFN